MKRQIEEENRLRALGLEAAEAKRQAKLKADADAQRAAEEAARKLAEEQAALEKKK
tara:strand:- start:617 stop:784 length:168 start_codon:yes stop_codon:yes gene_type:complete